MKVKALENLYEADGLHKRGEIFEVNQKRAKALGASVEAIEEPEKQIEEGPGEHPEEGGVVEVEDGQEENKKKEEGQSSQEKKKGILGSIKDRMIGQPPEAK